MNEEAVMLFDIFMILFVVAPVLSGAIYVGYRSGRTAQRRAYEDCLTKLEEERQAISVSREQSEKAHEARMSLLERERKVNESVQAEVQRLIHELQKEVQLSVQTIGKAATDAVQAIQSERRAGMETQKNIRSFLTSIEGVMQDGVGSLEGIHDARTKAIQFDADFSSTSRDLEEKVAETDAALADATGKAA